MNFLGKTHVNKRFSKHLLTTPVKNKKKKKSVKLKAGASCEVETDVPSSARCLAMTQERITRILEMLDDLTKVVLNLFMYWACTGLVLG